MKEILCIENQLFAPVSSIVDAIRAAHLVFNPYDYYAKMGYRNRFRILGANGPITLSIPLQGGRNKKLPAGEVMIAYEQPWQRSHWRTLVSAYARAPFFEYYAPELELLFHCRELRLWDFNLKAWQLLNRWLHAEWQFHTYHPQAKDANKEPANPLLPMITYPQVFGSTFVPNLSILDMLLNLGPQTRFTLLAQHHPEQ